MHNTESYRPGQAVRIMKEAGLQVTLPRLAVWMALERSDTPLLVRDLHRYLVVTGASVSLSSVYTALKRLTAAGLVAVQTFEGDKAHYTLMSRRIRHCIVCEDSGEEHWVAGPGLHDVIADLCEAHGFDLCDYTLSIQARPVDVKSSDQRQPVVEGVSEG
ncbi:MAG: transcriptional repressor [Pigmentiphaga sp.]|nr:transcriptional repressor [Pigmentiphaga sp.]